MFPLPCTVLRRRRSAGETCPARDAMEARLLDLALAADKPVLGICRGIQFLNAHLGGTLYQDLPAEHPSAANHHQTPPYDAPVHSVTLTAGQPALGTFGQGYAGCEQPAPSGHKNACAGAGGYGCLGGWTDGGRMPA